MKAFSHCRAWFSLVLALLLCCSCSTPEEQADAAYAQLCAQVLQLREQLALVADAEAAERAVPALEASAESLRDTLARIDELAENPDLPQDARRRVGERFHQPLHAAVEALLQQGERLGRRALFHSTRLKRLARHELAHYSARGVHPWPRAVLAGREYKPRPRPQHE